MYEHLVKLYYKDQMKYREEYEKRINSYGTVKLPFTIKPFNYTEEFSCFYVNHSVLDQLHDQILKQSKLIQKLERDIPPIGLSQYVKSKLVDELLSTNEIEGVYSTRREMETVIEIVVKKEESTKKVRHLSLMKTYFNLINENKSSITNVNEIREIYDLLVSDEINIDDKLDGNLFRNDTVEGVTSNGKVVHRGISPESRIKAYLTNLLDYLNNDASPMLYKIAIAHYLFGYIHPFYDGNGRTSRYMSSMYLINELDTTTALTLSYSTNNSKKIYYDAFSVSNDRKNKGELSYFCEVFFKIINDAQGIVIEDLSKKKEKIDILQERINSLDLSDGEKETLYIIGQHFIFGIKGTGISKKELQYQQGKTDYYINKEIKSLEEKGHISFFKKKPIEVTLSDYLRNLL
ncbi:Fic family protein [Anaerobacillus sp. MEB173]|uniref:Fic family protein n=1 Tax=Anaerobacillus sp. MEB173 TaxID=3383345 RepID=UPI003F9371C2